MNIAVDIGNTRIKCAFFDPDGNDDALKVWNVPLPKNGGELDMTSLLRELLSWKEEIITWRIAHTGNYPWQELETRILKVRLHDKFKIITRRQIPLKIDVDAPEKVGIDRLLAAFAAVKKYGNLPMMIVDAGTATTIDTICDRTFCGGAILPGLISMSEIYPKISEKLPLVPIPDHTKSYETQLPVYPGRNTADAIRNGVYWGTIGTIRQLYEIVFSKTRELQVLLTGGDGAYLLPGLQCMIPEQWIHHRENLVLEGINDCFSA